MLDPQVVEAYNQEEVGFVTNISVDKCPLYIAKFNQKFNKRTKIKRDTKIKKHDRQHDFYEP